jgi:hypothetical protein
MSRIAASRRSGFPACPLLLVATESASRPPPAGRVRRRRDDAPVPLAAWPSDVSELLRAAAALAWPLILAAVVWRIRRELPHLLRRVRKATSAFGSLELDPEVERLDEATEEAEESIRPQLPREVARPDGGTDVADAILRLAAQDARLGVVKLVTEIEVRVRDLASVAGHESPQKVPWHRLVEWLVERGTVPPGVASAVDLIRPVRNRVVHGQDRDLNDADVATTIDAGLRLLRILDAIPDYGYEVRAMVPIYADAAAETAFSDGRGVVLWDFDVPGNRRSYRVYPTRREYEPGQRVGWQWSFDHVWDEAYWRDPWQHDEILLAWSQSAEFVGQLLLRQEPPAS